MRQIINAKLEGIDPNSSFYNFSIDSRSVKDGDVFFCIKGDITDGHHYISQALEKKALAIVANPENIPDILKNKKFSKIPVYKDSVDNIKGILYAKDIIPYLMGSRPNINLLTLSRRPFFIPETKPIDDLLEDFKLKKKNVAIAVDEWGGTSGLITLEDIVEEVMGEISDPFDSEEYSFI